jgi:hypothetical protein
MNVTFYSFYSGSLCCNSRSVVLTIALLVLLLFAGQPAHAIKLRSWLDSSTTLTEGDVPSIRDSHGFASTEDGKIYVFGGSGDCKYFLSHSCNPLKGQPSTMPKSSPITVTVRVTAGKYCAGRWRPVPCGVMVARSRAEMLAASVDECSACHE